MSPTTLPSVCLFPLCLLPVIISTYFWAPPHLFLGGWHGNSNTPNSSLLLGQEAFCASAYGQVCTWISMWGMRGYPQGCGYTQGTEPGHGGQFGPGSPLRAQHTCVHHRVESFYAGHVFQLFLRAGPPGAECPPPFRTGKECTARVFMHLLFSWCQESSGFNLYGNNRTKLSHNPP